MLKTNNFPINAGVYLFKNKTNDVLYVGKAKNLKNRINSYFRDNHQDRPWIAVMLKEAVKVETITVKTETEALLLESTLIKEYEPRYNIKLTDDKAFPYIKAVTNEPIPRLCITRKVSKDKGKYFGPYLSAKGANFALEYLRIFFGVHISNTKVSPSDRSCLHCQMYGFTCPQINSSEDYSDRFNNAIEFLKGKRSNYKKLLEEKMNIAASNEQYELAARLRDQLTGISKLGEQQNVVTVAQETYDIITCAKTATTAIVGLNSVIDGKLTYRQNFTYSINNDSESEIAERFLLDTYQYKSVIAERIIISTAIENDSITKYLQQLSGHTVKLINNETNAILKLCLQDTVNQLELLLLKKDKDVKALIELKNILGLPFLPETIEAVDISNLGASEPVGAVVSFKNTKSDKDNYRKYKIKTVNGQNDFAMIEEVVRRRFSDTSRNVPDVFVVDGGPIQLQFALKALTSTPIQPKIIISLAKDPDRIFLPNKKRPLLISKNSNALKLLSKVRDEVHRFGLSFQRKRQQKRSLEE